MKHKALDSLVFNGKDSEATICKSDNENAGFSCCIFNSSASACHCQHITVNGRDGICTLFMLPRIQSSLEKLRNCLKFSIHVKYIQEYTLLNDLGIVQQAQLLYLYASASLETKHKQRQRECGQQRRVNYFPDRMTKPHTK